jgi:hypothetical protein
MNDVEQEKATIINDSFRDAAFNRRYYSCLLTRTKRLNLTLDVLVAVGSSATIAAWNVWQVGSATYIWKLLAGFSTLVALVKPFLSLPSEIQRYSELVSGWAAVFYDLKQITIRARTSGKVADDTWSGFEAMQHRVKELGLKDDPAVHKRLQRRCFDEIKVHIPPESLWWPEEKSNGRTREVPETTPATTGP